MKKLIKGDHVEWDSIYGLRRGVFQSFHKDGFAVVTSANSTYYLNKLDECNLRRVSNER